MGKMRLLCPRGLFASLRNILDIALGHVEARGMESRGNLMVEAEPVCAVTAARRDGMLFVLSPEATLPHRCVKCNAHAPGPRVSRSISTLSPWYPLFSSGGWNAHVADERPIYIGFSLCWRHRLQRLGRLALIGFIFMLNMMGFVLYKINPKPDFIVDVAAVLPGVLLFVATITLRPILRPRRVHHGLAWFAGAGAGFLESLPELE
jgi:hypothetical protein